METLSWGGVITRIFLQLSPVWIALIATFWISISNKRKLGLYGKLFDSTVGMIGFGIVMFWVFAALFSNVFGWLMPNEPQFFEVSMKHALPGEALPDGSGHYLLGGDKQARDVFSRMIYGSGIVIMIAPLATLMAFMVGITLGLPAGYFGGKLDTVLSFLANLILAFPVILLFYLLVTKEIVATGLPQYMAAVLFLFPLIFLTVLFNSRYYTDPGKRNPILIALWVIGGWIYLSFISQNGGDSAISILPAALDAFNPDPNILVVFVSVVFVNSPTVFRIVRGLTLDIKSRDYVAAGQTRGEGPWYIMLWEILPNVRGPLIVDFCLRIGYATILLGTLGFFGLGLETNSPDWGTTINLGRGL
ncbi:MAG: ABC transporter permease, partial [Halocynthiibacter sp.]